MREIKFRAWLPKEKLMIVNPKRMSISFDNFGSCLPVLWLAPFQGADSEERRDAKLMQFTGLRDKNGVEIYEADLLKIKRDFGGEDIVEVYWDAKAGALIVADDFGEGDLLPIGWALEHWKNGGDDVEVCGNIYEHPELVSK